MVLVLTLLPVLLLPPCVLLWLSLHCMPTAQGQLVMQHLVSVSVIGSHDDMTDESLSSTVHQEMSQWFGDKQTADWKLLKVYRVPFAQPNQVTETHPLTHSLTHSLTRSLARSNSIRKMPYAAPIYNVTVQES